MGVHVEKPCIVCGTKFLTRSRGWTREKFCSAQCRSRQHNRLYQDAHRIVVDRNRMCVMCGGKFVAPIYRPKAQTCSAKCNQKRQDQRRSPLRRWQPDGSTRSCQRCGMEFAAKKYGGERQRYCSPECRIETNRALALQRHSPESRLEKAHQHKWGGMWIAALKRDGWRCTVCGKDKQLQVHHLDGSGEADSPNHGEANLVTLCTGCHKKVHMIMYRIVDGEMYVKGFVFDWLKAGDTVKVLREP